MSKRIDAIICRPARLLCLAVLVPSALSFSLSCDKNKSAGGSRTIAVIPKGVSHVFWQSVKAGAERAGKETGVEIKWDGPPTEGDRNGQMRIIGDMINRGVDAMVIAPVDKTAITGSLETARKKMPVVIFDSGSSFKDYNAYVATDNYKGGHLAGEEMVRLLGNAQGEVALIRYEAGHDSTTQREQGFLDAVSKNPKLKIVETRGGDTADKAATASANLIVAHPNIIALFACNESTTRGSLSSLDKAKMLGKIKFIGFDSSPELVDALDKGHIQALVLQNPVEMGYRAVKAAVAALDNKSVEKEQPLPPTLVTPANIDKPEIQQLLRPKI
jgi:ribose transport system substrate-binding protein